MEMTKLKVLLTNDDGYHAEGLQCLYHTLKTDFEVAVVAPDRERSAVGHGITMHHPLRVTVVMEQHWMVDGTPADCVKIALESLLKDFQPQLIISGINRGPNLGNDVLYSGTVSAALEGSFYNIPSIATSLVEYGKADFTVAAEFIRSNMELFLETAAKSIINVNFPATTSFKGYKFTKLGRRIYENVFEERKDLRGRTYYWMGGEPVVDNQEDNSDISAVEEGYISITPLQSDLTNYKLLSILTSR